MRRIQSFDPSVVSNNPVINVGAADEGSQVLLYNLSPNNLDLDFYNGNNSVLHAWESRPWTLDGETRQIGWKIDSVISATPPPISLVMGELYGPGEKIEGTYPISLMHQTSVGNAVTTVGTTNQLFNTGNPSGTNVATVGSSLNAGNTVTLTNDGLLTLAVTIAGALVQAIKTFEPAAAGTILQVGAATYIAEVLGKLLVDSTAEFKAAVTVDAGGLNVLAGGIGVIGASSLDSGGLLTDGAGNFSNHGNINFTSGSMLLKAGGTNAIDATNTHDVIINAPNAGGIGQVIFQKGGVTNIKIDANGINFPNGNFLNNISFFTGAATGTFTHTFGSAPFWVSPVCQVAGSETVGYDTVTATQVHVTLGAALSFKAFCG
jgi:hypothetical protein